MKHDFDKMPGISSDAESMSQSCPPVKGEHGGLSMPNMLSASLGNPLLFPLVRGRFNRPFYQNHASVLINLTKFAKF